MKITLTTVLNEIMDCKESGMSNLPTLIFDSKRTKGRQIKARTAAIKI